MVAQQNLKKEQQLQSQKISSMKLLNGCQRKYIANKTMTSTEKSIVNKSISNQNSIAEVSINNQN
jgi:hypothetical protein